LGWIDHVSIRPPIPKGFPNEFSGNLYVILVSDMRASILPTDCQGCERGRPPSSLTWTITIDLANIGSLSTSTNTEQECISIATDYRPWTPDSSYVFGGTLSRIVETLRNCKECFLKLADNTVVYFYILCVTAIILISFLI